MPSQQIDPKDVQTMKTKNPDNQHFDNCEESENLVRTHIVRYMFKDLLGPKQDHDETIKNPYDQYMVGILKPRPTKEERSELEITTDPHEKASFENLAKYGDSDFESDDVDLTVPVDADLDLRRGTRSLGLSFVVSGTNPTIRICCTWGKYVLTSHNVYKRHTNVIITNPICVSESGMRLLDNKTHKIYNVSEPGAEIYVVVSPTHKDQHWNVSVFLLNNTVQASTPNKKTQWNTQSFFQPQIRITCENSALEDLGTSENDADDDNNLFQNKPTKGRGHLCGAVWKDVDPGCLDNNDFQDVLWPDSNSPKIPPDDRKRFLSPDIRTEFFPMYVIPQPDTNVSKELDLSADRLSELWDPNILKNKLTPIVRDYEDWIAQCEIKLKQENNTQKQLSHAHNRLAKCRKCATRIRNGIELLLNNEKARLSFCFMNKSIALKSQWSSAPNGTFSWRTFQIAFILQTLPGLTIPGKDADVCDILWFPTGGGKTEAYMGLMLFSFAYRRLCTDPKLEMDGGVSVISRYTLRLLSLQQFRRTLDVVLGAELLRVQNWLPANMGTINDTALDLRSKNTNIWGESRFAIGLWVGGDLTPNVFSSYSTPTNKVILNAQGALSPTSKSKRTVAHGDPAQIHNCPCCHTTLAIPESESISNNDPHTLIWIIKLDRNTSIDDLNKIPDSSFCTQEFKLCKKNGSPAKSFRHLNKNESGLYCAMHVNFKSARPLSSGNVDLWWEHTVMPALKINQSKPLQPTKASRPGYFFLRNENSGTPYDFAIHCPNNNCPTWTAWQEKTIAKSRPVIADAFIKSDNPTVSISVPIPAFTIDEQVYGRCPTVIIATTDKFAQLAFKPEAASIFGNVDSHRSLKGFYRKMLLSDDQDVATDIPRFFPPSLIIQDELHLIEGPLGSMVGLYELAVDVLSSQAGHKPKYVASSATVKEASRQVGLIYQRSARVFPPNGVYDGENYFSHTREDPTCTKNQPGRLYIGVLVPRGMLLGLVKTYASLLSSVHKHAIDDVDPYWTLVGYFNAIRELSIAMSLYNSDIQRDVTELSSNEYFSTQQKKSSMSFSPSTKLIPIKVTQDATLYSITVYFSNNLEKISLALYSSDSKTHKPSKLLSTVNESTARSVDQGSKKFILSQPITCSKNSIVYVALHNYSCTTKFVCGSEINSYVTSSLQSSAQSIVFDTIRDCTQEKTSIMVSVGTRPRDLDPSRRIELSSIVSSSMLPKILELLETPNFLDALFTTSIFGTGVDINRLGLMIVAGQPKSTASYIQSTGRIGRKHPGLIVTWLRATRVRDLSHYENFIGYHRQINRFVEPISSAPFSYKSFVTCLGPVLVAILRNSDKINDTHVSTNWATNPNHIIKNRNSKEVIALEKNINELYKNLKTRVDNLQLDSNDVKQITKSTIERWLNCAQRIERDNDNNTLKYSENTFQEIRHHVVLGTHHHKSAKLTSVYENARNSLRDVESTFTVKEKETIENV